LTRITQTAVSLVRGFASHFLPA